MSIHIGRFASIEIAVGGPPVPDHMRASAPPKPIGGRRRRFFRRIRRAGMTWNEWTTIGSRLDFVTVAFDAMTYRLTEAREALCGFARLLESSDGVEP